MTSSNKSVVNTTKVAVPYYAFEPSEELMSSAVRLLVERTVDLGLCLPISMTGILTNALVISVFAHQNPSTNATIITLTAIAFWDLVTCSCCVLHRLYGFIEIQAPAMAHTWKNVSTFIFLSTQVYSGFVSGVLAALVAVERCICVSLPFKAKVIITPRRTIIVIVIISVIIFASFLPYQCTFRFVYVYSEEFRERIFVFVPDPSVGTLYSFYNLMATILPLASFIVMTFCAVVITHHMRRSTAFRSGAQSTPPFQVQSSTSTTSSVHAAIAEKKVGKMLVTLILVYIALVCVPRLAVDVIRLIEPEFFSHRRHHNLFYVTGYISYVFALANATVNFFIFLNMNSAFRQTFYAKFYIFAKVKKSPPN